jgi:hypothetical protein
MPLEVLPYKASAAIPVQYQQNAVVDFADDRTRAMVAQRAARTMFSI